MATATKRSQAARQVARRAAARSDSAGITFLVVEDNSGDYYWTILGERGESLAQSVPFATYEDALRVARLVRDAAGSARLEGPPSADHPVDLLARREAAIGRDDSAAERWLDEGGSFSSEAVTQWPAGH